MHCVTNIMLSTRPSHLPFQKPLSWIACLILAQIFASFDFRYSPVLNKRTNYSSQNIIVYTSLRLLVQRVSLCKMIDETSLCILPSFRRHCAWLAIRAHCLVSEAFEGIHDIVVARAVHRVSPDRFYRIRPGASCVELEKSSNNFNRRS